jgi:hypothetical protein
MARVSRTVCDLHLSRGEEVDATTRSIAIDGAKASVDLCDSCYQENIQPVLDLIGQLPNQTPAKKAPPKTAKKTPAKKTAARKRSRGQRGPTPAAIRKWAQEQGIEVSASGRVPQVVRDQYLAAH